MWAVFSSFEKESQTFLESCVYFDLLMLQWLLGSRWCYILTAVSILGCCSDAEMSRSEFLPVSVPSSA